jgi:hypothetical protein
MFAKSHQNNHERVFIQRVFSHFFFNQCYFMHRCCFHIVFIARNTNFSKRKMKATNSGSSPLWQMSFTIKIVRIGPRQRVTCRVQMWTVFYVNLE